MSLETHHNTSDERPLSELDASGGHEPLVTVAVLRRIGLILLIAFALAMAAQVLFGAPR